MERTRCRTSSSSFLLALLAILTSIPCSTQLQSSQSWSLLRLQRLLNYPPALSSWNNHTSFCYSDPSPSLTVACYGDSISQLHIIGEPGTPPLPKDFAIDSFFTTLTRLPHLKVLTLSSLGLWGPLPTKIWRLPSLEIFNISSNYLSGPIPHELSYLKSLQTLILDHNMFAGDVPDWLSAFPLLAVLSLKNNSLNGHLPKSIISLENLRVLSIPANNMSGELPDLSRLSNLQVLDLEDNGFGPQFPTMQRKITTIKLRNNRFTGALPQEINSYYLLHHLDVSSNRFVGPFPSALLNLPSIRYLNISQNRFTGKLFSNMSCNSDLDIVDLSSNLLTGRLPTCLVENSGRRNASYSMNCFTTNNESQHPFPFCRTEALAVGELPPNSRKTSASKVVVLITSAIGGATGGVLLVGFVVFFSARRAHMRKAARRPPRRLIEHASNGHPSRLSDARYISQTMKLGSLGIPPYRSFSLEELEAATNNFEFSAYMGEGSHGQIYRGKLKDDSLVAIRCLKLKRSHRSYNFIHLIELLAKLRHRHLVSALGHCFEYNLEDSTISRVFFVFEYVPNGTLRSQISEDAGQEMTWTERIATAIGVVRGLEFLHSGIIPGSFANNLKSENVLLDQNFLAKIDSYNLPVLSEAVKAEVDGAKERRQRERNEDKIDIYDFGVILLEIVTGKPFNSQGEVEIARRQLKASIAADGMMDAAAAQACSRESLRTVTEVCIRCLSKEPTRRPSVEDVLWNLQFAAQVQSAWRGDSQSSDGSLSPSHLPPT